MDYDQIMCRINKLEERIEALERDPVTGRRRLFGGNAAIGPVAPIFGLGLGK